MAHVISDDEANSVLLYIYFIIDRLVQRRFSQNALQSARACVGDYVQIDFDVLLDFSQNKFYPTCIRSKQNTFQLCVGTKSVHLFGHVFRFPLNLTFAMMKRI